MASRRLLLLAVIPAVFLSGCASETVDVSVPTSPSASSSQIGSTPTKTPSSDGLSPTSSPQPSESIKVSRTSVLWADYEPGLQTDIDQMTTNQDCQGLQTYFGYVTATEESVRAKTGHGNEALEKYLEESVRLSGCG